MPTDEIVKQGRGADRLAQSSFPQMLQNFKSEIARALPRHLNPDRMCRIALTEFRKNPKLADCDPRSVFAAIIIASQLGLEPGVLGQCYLIPYKRECQLIVGYQGLVDLVRRSGFVSRIEAHVVHERDQFTYKTGLSTVLEHEPVLEGDPGKPRLVYAVAEFKDGGYHVEVMTEEQIGRIRDRSQSVINAKNYGKQTPWDTDTEEMWRKTVLRRICKFLPKSPEIATAIALDEASEQGRQAIGVEDAIHNTWQAPILEVTTQDNRLADKSAQNLEAVKERHQLEAQPEDNTRPLTPLEANEASARRKELEAQAARLQQARATAQSPQSELPSVAPADDGGVKPPPEEYQLSDPLELEPVETTTEHASPALDFDGPAKKTRR